MTWGIFLFASIVTQAIANILNRVVMRDANKHTWAYAALSQILTGSLIGLYAFATNSLALPPFLELWPWFLLTIFLNVGANIFQNEALRTAEISFYTILSSCRTIISMLAALLVLGEYITWLQALGAVTMLSAIAIAFSKRFEFTWHTWMGYALLYALCSGLVFIADAGILSEFPNVSSYMAFAFFMPGIATMLFKPKIIPEVVHLALSKQSLRMVMYSATYGFMAITLWLAYLYGATASQIAPIRQSAVILTVVLAMIFLHERAHVYRKIFAALLAVLAVYLIA